MKVRILPRISIVGAGTLAVCTIAAAPAWADPMVGPSSSDVVPPAPVSPPASPPPAAAPPSVTRGTVALAAAGIALAGAGTAVVFGALALQNKRDFQANPTYATANKGDNDAAYADGAIALAVSAGITSLVLWLTRDAAWVDPGLPASRPPNVSASLVVTSHGAGALVHF